MRCGGAAPAHVVVAGVGSEYRRDDGAGPAVASEVAGLLEGVVELGPLGGPLDLLGLWDGASLAVVVDATRSGALPGTVQVIDLDAAPLEAGRSAGASTHGIGLVGVLRLARALGSAPHRVVAVGIEGDDFSRGTGLSPAVGRAVAVAANRVVELIREVR